MTREHIDGLRGPDDRWIDASEPPTDAEERESIRHEAVEGAFRMAMRTFSWQQPGGADWVLENAAPGEIVMRKRLFDAGLAYYEAASTEPWNAMRRKGTETALGAAQLASEQAIDALAALVQEDGDADHDR